MSTAETPVPPKHRLDIVDTAVVQQKEKQALKWLAILLLVALCYENTDVLLSPFSSPPIEATALNTAMRRPFPDKRINRLTQVLRGVQQTFPLVRDSLKPHIENLDWLKDQTPQKTGQAILQARLATALESLWHLFHSPIWEDTKPFDLAVLEMKSLFKLMRLEPPSESEIPPLVIGPRPMDGLELAGRDLFQFVDSRETPEEAGR